MCRQEYQRCEQRNSYGQSVEVDVFSARRVVAALEQHVRQRTATGGEGPLEVNVQILWGKSAEGVVEMDAECLRQWSKSIRFKGCTGENVVRRTSPALTVSGDTLTAP